jgi:hypothetical protein
MQWNSLPDQFYPIPQQMSRREERPTPSRSKKPRYSHPTTLNQRRRLRPAGSAGTQACACTRLSGN